MTVTTAGTTPTRANAEQVRARLRADIFAGAYEPGEKLKFAPLGRRYGASMGVLREALTALVEQRLVSSEPRIGFRVAQLSITDLEDLTVARIAVETAAVRLAVASDPPDWLETVTAAHRRLVETAMMTPDTPARVSDAWEQAHVEFHQAVVDGCGSARLADIARSLRDSAELYRRWSGPRSAGRDVAAEHARILDAVARRDADGAARALTDHYRGTLDVLRRAAPSA